MKKILKSRILTFILGGIIFSGITAYAASQILASDISYRDGTVESALNDLYTKANSNSGLISDYPSITKVWQSLSQTISYNSTFTEAGTYLVVTKNSTNEHNLGTINTTGEIKLEDTLHTSNGSSLIKVIEASAGDTIEVSLYNSSTNPANAFIVKLNNIELTEIVSSTLTNDATATLTYTATTANEKVLAIAISNASNRTSSISYTGNYITTLYNDNSINVSLFIYYNI